MMAFWATRSKQDAADYWATRGAGYRGLLASMLAPLAPFQSLLEIGSHSGPNLWAIRQQWPLVHLIGLEPSEACAKYGQCAAVAEALERLSPAERQAFDRRAASSGEVPSVGVDFFVGSAPSGLGVFTSIDVVVSCFTLAYLSDQDLQATLAAVVATAKRGVLLVEPMATETEPGGVVTDVRVPYTRHDYRGWFTAHAPTWHVDVLPFPGPQGLNRALRARPVVS